jgi:hypothetical protein
VADGFLLEGVAQEFLNLEEIQRGRLAPNMLAVRIL